MTVASRESVDSIIRASSLTRESIDGYIRISSYEEMPHILEELARSENCTVNKDSISIEKEQHTKGFVYIVKVIFNSNDDLSSIATFQKTFVFTTFETRESFDDMKGLPKPFRQTELMDQDTCNKYLSAYGYRYPDVCLAVRKHIESLQKEGKYGYVMFYNSGDLGFIDRIIEDLRDSTLESAKKLNPLLEEQSHRITVAHSISYLNSDTNREKSDRSKYSFVRDTMQHVDFPANIDISVSTDKGEIIHSHFILIPKEIRKH